MPCYLSVSILFLYFYILYFFLLYMFIYKHLEGGNPFKIIHRLCRSHAGLMKKLKTRVSKHVLKLSWSKNSDDSM